MIKRIYAFFAIVFLPASSGFGTPPPYSLIGEVGSARSRGLGGGGTALAGDAALLWRNPTAAARQSSPSVTLAGQKGYIDDMTWQLSGAFARGGPWVFAAGAAYYDAGQINLTASDGTSSRVDAQQEALAAVNVVFAPYSRAAGGITVKIIRSELLSRFASAAAAADAGVAFGPVGPLSAGAAILNWGRTLKYRGERLTLPTTAEAGAALATGRESPAIIADFGYRFDVKETEWNAGMEYTWRGALSIRAGAGMPALRNSPVYSLGIGLRGGRIQVDYAIRLAGEAGTPNDLSLTLLF
jgi:hypothetical protein